MKRKAFELRHIQYFVYQVEQELGRYGYLLQTIGYAVLVVHMKTKYTPNKGLIQISVEEKPSVYNGYGQFEIAVTDNGIGMKPEFLSKVFEPFERSDVFTGYFAGYIIIIHNQYRQVY